MVKLSLSMIVKNEEVNLPRCLESVKDVVDEIVIVDTGSTDNTPKIAEQFNAKVIFHKWVDDFSEARNIALKNSTGDYILYLDADEILSKQSVNDIKKLIKKDEKNTGYLCTITSIDDFTKQNNSIQYVRFFRNSDKIEFRGKAHEQITDSLLENGYNILKSNIEIIHYGYNISKDGKKLKAQRNLKLLLQGLEISPSDYNYFQIAQSYFIMENYKEAEKYFNLVISSGKLSKDLLAESYSYLAQINHFKFDVSNTKLNIHKAITLNSNQPFYFYLLSKVYQRQMDYPNSLVSLKKAYELNNSINKLKKSSLQSVHLNNYELLFSLLDISKKNNDSKNLVYFGNQLLKEIQNQYPDKRKNFELLIKILTKNQILDKNNFQDLLEIIDGNNFDLILQLLDTLRDAESKLEILNQLYELFPEKVEVIKRIAIINDGANETEKAVKFLEKNFDKIMEDPSALFYLASFQIKCNNLKRALEIFELIDNKFPYISSLNSKVKEIKEKMGQFIGN